MLHTRGIVVRTLRYGESSVITDIFTAEKGLCSFIGGSVRTARSRMPFSLFQPLSPVVLVSYWKEDVSALHRLKECRADMPLTGIPFELKKGAVALFMAEVLRKCLHPGEAHPALFEFLSEVVQYTDVTPGSVAHLPLYFLVHLAEHLGIQPHLPDPEEGPQFFDLREGYTSVLPPAHGLHLSPDDTDRLRVLTAADIADIADLAFTGQERRHLLHRLLTYYQIHVEGFNEINTPDVLELVLK